MDKQLGQVVSKAELTVRRGGWKRDGQVVVCAVGRFDLLHPGHVRFLEQARALGNVLVVGVESDAQVREAFVPSSKPARPITPASERAEILAALACVDFAIELDSSPRQFLEILAPDIFAEGAAQDAPRATQQSHPHLVTPAPKLVRIPLEPGYSTAGLIERITRVRS